MKPIALMTIILTLGFNVEARDYTFKNETSHQVKLKLGYEGPILNQITEIRLPSGGSQKYSIADDVPHVSVSIDSGVWKNYTGGILYMGAGAFDAAGGTYVIQDASKNPPPQSRPALLPPIPADPNAEKIKLKDNVGCLDIDGHTGQLTRVNGDPGGRGVLWRVHHLENGYIALQNDYTGKYLDVDGHNFGTLMMEPFTKFGGCHWRLVESGTPGYFQLENQFWSNRKNARVGLSVNGSGSPCVEQLQGDDRPQSRWEVFNK